MGFLALFEMTALHKSFSQWLLKFTRVFTRSKGVVNLRTANCKTCRVSYVLCAFFLLEMSMLLVLAMQNLEKCLFYIDLLLQALHRSSPQVQNSNWWHEAASSIVSDVYIHSPFGMPTSDFRTYHFLFQLSPVWCICKTISQHGGRRPPGIAYFVPGAKLLASRRSAPQHCHILRPPSRITAQFCKDKAG